MAGEKKGKDSSPPPAPPSPSTSTSRGPRQSPAPWIDCPQCGWRHYPDVGIRRGPQIAAECSNCGAPLPPPTDPAAA